MISLLEAQYRCENGPMMAEDDFNLKYMKAVRAIAKRYDIKTNPEEIIPSDEVADQVFLAAIDLIVEVGLYHINTNRVLHFTREEIMRTAKTRKGVIRVGDNNDAVIIKKRYPGDPTRPVMALGPGGSVDDSTYVHRALSFAKLPEMQGISPGALTKARGFINKAGTPGELQCALAEAYLTREVMRRAGKPNMFTVMPMSSINPYAILASFNENGYSPKNAIMPTQVFPDMKIDWNHLLCVSLAQEFGMLPWGGAFVTLYTYTRTPVEAAIAKVASSLGCMTYSGGQHMRLYLCDRSSRRSTPDVMQAEAMANLAIVRNIEIPTGGGAQSIAGPCTAMTLQETAAQTLMLVASGAAFMWYCANETASNTGMEARMACEVGWSVTEMERGKANEIINRIYEIYQPHIKNPPPCKMFEECYDIERVEPLDEYKAIYAQTKEQLSGLGIPFRY